MSAELNARKFGLRVICPICHQQKQPLGRSAPLGTMMCIPQECGGYYEKPFVGSLWPNESEADFGYEVGTIGVEIKEAE